MTIAMTVAVMIAVTVVQQPGVRPRARATRHPDWSNTTTPPRTAA